MFRDYCGDQFVIQTSMGASLYVALTINFQTFVDKSKFQAHIGASMASIFNASASLQNVINHNATQGSLEVHAYQIGGEPEKLAGIFSNNQKDYYVTSCNFNNISKCQNAINVVISYAQNDFSQQVDFYNNKILENAIPLSYSYQSYEQLGLVPPLQPLPEDILAACKTLGNLYMQVKPEYSDIVRIQAGALNSYYKFGNIKTTLAQQL